MKKEEVNVCNCKGCDRIAPVPNKSNKKEMKKCGRCMKPLPIKFQYNYESTGTR